MDNHKLYKAFLRERDIIQIEGEEKFEFLQDEKNTKAILASVEIRSSLR